MRSIKRHFDREARLQRVYGDSRSVQPPSGKPIPEEFKIRLLKNGKSCTCEALILISHDIGEIEKHIAKLRESVVSGVYDERSIVGDAVLRMEGILLRIHEHIPRLPEASIQPKRHPKKIKK